MRTPRPDRNLHHPYRAVFYRHGSPLEVKQFERKHVFRSIAEIKHHADMHWFGQYDLMPTQVEVFVVQGPLWHQMAFYACYVKTANGWRKVSEEEGDALRQRDVRREIERQARATARKARERAGRTAS